MNNSSIIFLTKLSISSLGLPNI